MGDKSEAIAEAKRVEEQLKQEQLREQKAEKPQESQGKNAEVKPEAAQDKPAEKTAEKVTDAPAAAKQVEEKKAEKPAEKKEEKKKEERKFVLERIYSVPLRKAFRKSRSHRARVAVSLLKQFVARHAKSQNVYLDPKVNSLVLERGARNPPKLVKVLVQKDDAGRVFVGLPSK